MAYYEYCPEHNGIEIYFDERPDEEYLSELRDNGWRWHRYKKCWYNFRSDDNEEFAEAICDTFNDEYGYDCEDDEEECVSVDHPSALSGNMIKQETSAPKSYYFDCMGTMRVSYDLGKKQEAEKTRLIRETIEKAERGHYGQKMQIGSDGFVNVDHGFKFMGQ